MAQKLEKGYKIANKYVTNVAGAYCFPSLFYLKSHKLLNLRSFLLLDQYVAFLEAVASLVVTFSLTH